MVSKEHVYSYVMCVVYRPWCKCYALTWRVSRLKTDFGSKENQTLIVEKNYNDAISCLRFLNLIDAGLGVCIPSLLQQLCIGRYISDEVLWEQKRKGRAVSLIPRSISRHILSLLVPLTFLWFYPTRPWIMREIKQQYFFARLIGTICIVRVTKTRRALRCSHHQQSLCPRVS